MGTVYLAEETTTGRRVALKLLAPELARDERFRRRFLRETELAASLDHPHVVETLASGEEDGALYLAMAYVDGSDLRELLLREGRLDAERAVGLVGQVAAALDAAHDAGLVHRDVKPGNILVATTDDGEQAYVCDFGLARHVSSVSSLTGERGFVGTIDYVPPEQIEGGTIDGRADLYSLGCVLFECIAGARPFDRESELSVVFAHLNEPPPRLSNIRPELPEAFDGVFENALAKSPDERYSTCGELAAAARAALRGKTFVRRRLRRRRVLLGAAVLLAAVGAAVAGILTSRGHAHGHAKSPSISLEPAALNLIDARTHRVVGRISSRRAGFAKGVAGITFSKTAAWVTTAGQSLVRVDLATRRVTAVRQLPWIAGVVTDGRNAVWLLQDVGQEIIKLDARNGKIAGRFQVRGDPTGWNAGGAAYADGSLWLARGNGVVRIDPRTGRVQHRFPAASRWLVFADGAIWAAEPASGHVWKIDPATNSIVQRTKLHGWLSSLAVGGGSVWAPILPDGVVFKLSEDDLGIQANPSSGADPATVSFGSGHLWIANSAAKTVSQLDDVSGARRELSSETRPTTVAYHRGLVWTAAAAAPTPLPPIKGEELRVSTPTDTAVDPDPMGGNWSVHQLMYAICSSLLYYPDSAGSDGTRLRPEIAGAMPTVSPDGRTYTFRIRSGYQFSPPSGEAVTARTFQHTLERALSPKNVYSAGPRLASDIVGVSAYRAGKTKHIRGIAAHGNTLAITLVRPAGDFLTRISMFAFCPVPLTVPIHVNGFAEHPIPSAGPYYISSIQGERTVLKRNPNYPGRRPRRAERIVYTNNIPTASAVALADRGAVDVLPWDFDNTTPLMTIGGVLDRDKGSTSAAARSGKQQYFRYQAPLVDAIAFNTRRPLFRDVRLRRAVNYALDRPGLAAAFGDTPADQIVPGAVHAFPALHAYPVDGPDFATARKLAGNRRRHAVIAICGGDARLPTLAEIVRKDLARIRITASVIQSRDCPGRAEEADLTFLFPIGNDVLDPAPFLHDALESSLFGSPLGPGPWHSKGFRSQLKRADALRGEARTAAFRRIDDRLMRMAPLAVFGDWVWAEYLSPKVGCKVFQGEWGVVDLGALCKPS